VAVDGFGHVYVADALYDNLQIFDGKGRFLLDVGRAGPGPGEFWMPAGVAIGRNDEIYVADSYNGRVQVFRYVGTP
jgi:DNA-binding beta-propeller fold protein YncE